MRSYYDTSTIVLRSYYDRITIVLRFYYDRITIFISYYEAFTILLRYYFDSIAKYDPIMTLLRSYPIKVLLGSDEDPIRILLGSYYGPFSILWIMDSLRPNPRKAARRDYEIHFARILEKLPAGIMGFTSPESQKSCPQGLWDSLRPNPRKAVCWYTAFWDNSGR